MPVGISPYLAVLLIGSAIVTVLLLKVIMGWFTRNPGVTAERRVDELDAEIAEITALEERLTQASEEPNDPGQRSYCSMNPPTSPSTPSCAPMRN